MQVNALLHHVGGGSIMQGGTSVSSPAAQKASSSSQIATPVHHEAVVEDTDAARGDVVAHAHGDDADGARAVAALARAQLTAAELAGGVVRPGIVHRLDRGGYCRSFCAACMDACLVWPSCTMHDVMSIDPSIYCQLHVCRNHWANE